MNISTMGKDELAKTYATEVGYNPFEDDPAITVDEVRSSLIEFLAEVDA